MGAVPTLPVPTLSKGEFEEGRSSDLFNGCAVATASACTVYVWLDWCHLKLPALSIKLRKIQNQFLSGDVF